MTGPYDGRPGGWQQGSGPSGSEPGGTAGGDQPAAPRQLPPELDPRGPRRPNRPVGSPRRLGRIRSWSRRKILVVTAGGVAALLVITLGIGAIAVSSILHGINRINPFSSSYDRPGGGAVGDLNILVVGSDSRKGLTAQQQSQLHVGHDPGQRSDTMILLHIPSGGGKATLLSLPRDSYVTIPAHTTSTGQKVPAEKNKLNAAYSEGGAKLTVHTIEANTGVRIDHYLEINFLGFVKMVNALGGVDICNGTAINDPVRRDPATGGYIGSGLRLPAGNVHLDGTTALEYVRAREFDPSQGDLGRIQRQQKFMGALLRKAESLGVLLNPVKLYGFLKSVASSLTTDQGFGTKQIKTLLERLHSMSPANVTLLTVPLSNTALATPVGSAVEWDPVKSRKLFADFTNDKPITNVVKPKPKLTVAPGSISLKVLNATSQNGLAAGAADALSRIGFHIAGTGNAPKGSNPATTVVQYGASRADSARTVAAAVPGAVLHEDNSLGSGLQLVVGSNYKTVHAVHISSSPSRTTATTAAANSCS